MCSSTQTTHRWSPTYITRGVCGHVHLQTGVPNPPVIPREVVVSASSLHPGGPQYRSRHPVETGLRPRELRLQPEVVELIWREFRPGTSVTVYVLRDVSLSTLVLPHASSSSWTGRDDADVTEASSVCISPDRSAPGSPGGSSAGTGFYYIH